tara:strand:- start:1817 stop:1954 length:138 start_codon:yes stop_codon:yes gene_type:complete
MAGTDTAGYGGFNDRVNNRYLKSFGSAILVAMLEGRKPLRSAFVS